MVDPSRLLCIDELDKTVKPPGEGAAVRLLDERYARAVRAEAVTVIAANYERLDELTGYLRAAWRMPSSATT